VKVNQNPNIAGMGKPDLVNVNPLQAMQGSYKNQPA
jgi:hypothetical protein